MNLLQHNSDYKKWLTELKQKVRITQLKAAISVNSEMLNFYWELGADIVAKQSFSNWGEGFIKQLSADLTTEFVDLKGFSERNLKYIRQWYLFYSQDSIIGQQAVAQLTQIPWGHNLAIISKCKNITEALYYVQNTLTHNWSRSVLIHQIENKLFEREGKSTTNFSYSFTNSTI